MFIPLFDHATISFWQSYQFAKPINANHLFNHTINLAGRRGVRPLRINSVINTSYKKRQKSPGLFSSFRLFEELS